MSIRFFLAQHLVLVKKKNTIAKELSRGMWNPVHVKIALKMIYAQNKA